MPAPLPPEQRALREERRRFEAAWREQLRRRASLLRSTRDSALAALKGAADAIAALLAEQPADWRQWQLQSIQGQVQALIDGLSGRLTSDVDAALVRGWAAGAASVDAPFAAAGSSSAAGTAGAQADFLLPTLDTSVLGALRSFTAGRIKDLTAQADAAVDQAVHLVALGAQTPQQAVRQVQAALGADSAAAQRARRIVLTSVGEAHAVAAQQRLEDKAALVPGLQKQWLRSGKIHSRWNHDAVDGQVVDARASFRLPTKQAGGFVLMKHPHDPKAPPAEVINCGCVARPWLQRWGLPEGGKPFSDREIALNPLKRNPAAWKSGRGVRKSR